MAPFLDESRIDDDEPSPPSTPARRCGRWPRRAPRSARRSTLSTEARIDRVAGGERPRSVLVASLGGSAVVGDVLDLLAEPGSPVPVSVRRNLPLPGWVGPLDLVIAVSLSGRAAGPLALAAEAARRGASLLTVGAADSPLADVCARARGVHIDVGRGRSLLAHRRSGRCSPRCCWRPTRWACSSAGDAGAARDGRPARRGAEACRPRSESFVNPAKILAIALAESIPWCSATARSTASPPSGPPRCWPAPPGCRRSTASCPTPPRRSWRRSTGRSPPAAAAGRASGSPRRTSSPTRSSTGRPSPASAC